LEKPTAAPVEKRDGEKPPTELEILRREIELLKLKLEVVQEKQRAQEAELRALRTATGKSTQPDLERLRGMEMAWKTYNLQWPQHLQGEVFKDFRENFSRHLKQAISMIQLHRNPDASTLNDLQADLTKLYEALGGFPPDPYPHLGLTEARRYLQQLGDVIMALRKFNNKESKQDAMDALEAAVKKLREQTNKPIKP
jgi:hypothetical protein